MKYSVITVNYNNKDGLSHTIKSVITQTCKDYEFIVIDGGSNDGSIDIIKKNENNINHWISEKDNGIYHAMNKGVALANGDYCIFMNSGDCFYSNNVLDFFNNINSGEDIVVGKVSVDKYDNILTPPPTNELSMYHLYSGAIPHQGAFIRTSLLRKIPYDENLRITSDWKFFIQTLILDNCTIRYIDEFVAIYDTEGISSSNPQLMHEEKEMYLRTILPPRILLDYKKMKESECKTQALTPLLRKNYKIDCILYTLGNVLIKLKNLFSSKHEV